MHSEPAGDPTAYRRLVEGAREASDRGAPDAAVVYLRRALEEPPPRDTERQTLIQLAIAEGSLLKSIPRRPTSGRRSKTHGRAMSAYRSRC
jgi:hypothetical protein